MRIASKRAFVFGLFMAAATLALDQFSKWAMLELVGIEHNPPLELAPFFNIVMVWNHGISFGLFAGQRVPVALVASSLIITCILLGWLYKNASLLTAFALGCVIGGALGNVIDRLRFGAVVDFLDFHIGQYHWPAFNVADSTIFIGVVLLCAGSMFSGNK